MQNYCNSLLGLFSSSIFEALTLKRFSSATSNAGKTRSNCLFASAFISVTIFGAATLLTGCADLNAPGGGGYRHDPYYGSGGYGSGGYDRRYDHPNGYGSGDFYREQERERLRRERDRLEREQDRLERERREVERERDRNRYTAPPPVYQPPAYNPPSSPPQREERCPSGFSPSERKCSQDERRRGCKDMRLPGGLGCVRR
jgi:hypothetical protein